MAGIPSQEFVTDHVEQLHTTTTVNESLEWWQWLVIGTFIPSIFEMVRMMRKAIFGGVL